MSTTITNVRPEAERISKLLTKISFESGKDMYSLVRQAMIFGVQSAVKWTYPSTATTAAGLARKWKMRPTIKDDSFNGFFYYGYMDRSGNKQMLRTKNPIDLIKHKKEKYGFYQINTAYKAWDRKNDTWEYLPYDPSRPSDRMKARERIPHAGAAKVGWYGSLKQLGQAVRGTMDNDPGRLSLALIRKGNRESAITITNMVDYVGKTSPDSARVGLENAEKRLVKTYEKKLDMVLKGAY